MTVDELLRAMEALSSDDKRKILVALRERFGLRIHALEEQWNTSAETILEAISTASDLTQRGVRGILAEACFRTSVIPQLAGWKDITTVADDAYDALVVGADGRQVRIQVKLQRREKGVPKLMPKRFGEGIYAVETQRTRTGKQTKTNSDGSTEEVATRPYRRDEYDVLAVCLQPLTGTWDDFVYCAANRLLRRASIRNLLEVMQPIYLDESHHWTRLFDRAVTDSREIVA